MKTMYSREEIIQLIQQYSQVPTNMATTNTEQTITANKTVENANLYKHLTGYTLSPQNTGFANNSVFGKVAFSLSKTVGMELYSGVAEQQNDYISIAENDDSIWFKITNEIGEYEFKVNPAVGNSVGWTATNNELGRTKQGTIDFTSGGAVLNTRDMDCTANGQWMLTFNGEVNIYSFYENTVDVYRYIAVNEKGTKIYHHHIKVYTTSPVEEDAELYVDIITPSGDSFEGKEWTTLLDSRSIGMATLYTLDENTGEFLQSYTITGFKAETKQFGLLDFENTFHSLVLSNDMIEYDFISE